MGGYEVGDYEFGWLGGWGGLGWVGACSKCTLRHQEE